MQDVPEAQLQSRSTPAGAAQSASIRDVMASFQVLRSSVLDLFGAAGVDPTKSREMARDLGLNRGLAWKLSRIARSMDGTDIAHDVPGPQSMAKFIQTCQSRGADSKLVDRALKASAEYEVRVTSCSGGRKTLAMLLANQGQLSTSQERERARRALFEGACSVWGVQAQTRFVTVFLFKSKDNPRELNAAHVTGYVGFRRLDSRPWPMSYEAVHHSDGGSLQIQKEPLDPTGSEEGELQLMPAFCDPPNPHINVRVQGDYKAFDLAAGPVGNEGLTTCVFGSYIKSIFSLDDPGPNTAGFMVLLQTPVERVLFDLFIHKDIETHGPEITHLLDRLTYPHSNREEDFDSQSMPIAETGRPLPSSIHGAATPHIAWYPRLLESIMNRVHVSYEEFNGSRFEMNYPPISTTLSRRFLLEGGPVETPDTSK